MIRRRAAKPKERPAAWNIHTSTQINGRNVERGTELSIKGERGRFHFYELVEAPSGSWVTVYAVDGGGGARSFSPDRVKTVHIKKKARR
jgi:hypothetical protein